MPIHHAVIKRAEKAGIILTEQEEENAGSPRRFKAHWPKRNVVLHGGEVKYLLNDMIAVQTMENQYPSFEWEIEDDDTVTIDVKGTNISVRNRAQAAFEQAKKMWIESRSELDVEDEEADNEIEAEQIAEEAEEEKAGGGSVVNPKYRLLYAEQGHPNHCGDWLATLLVNLCTNKEGINIDLFALIVEHNGVDMSKYKREGHGWQGRFRMTGRNLLAKRVYLNGGVLNMPDTINGGEPYLAPQEWMTTQRFKMPKADQAKAQPEPGAVDEKAEAA